MLPLWRSGVASFLLAFSFSQFYRDKIYTASNSPISSVQFNFFWCIHRIVLLLAQSILDCFHPTKKKSCAYLAVTPHSLPPTAEAATNLLFPSPGWPPSDIPHQQNPMWCFVTPFLSLVFSRLIHVVAHSSTLSAFWLNNIPLYGFTTFSLFFQCLRDLLLFALLGCYGNAAVCIHVQVFVETCVLPSLRYRHSSGIAGICGHSV